jgi:hypothetical protein
MKTLNTIIIVAIAALLMQCDESPQKVTPVFDESSTSAAAKKQPFVIYAVTREDYQNHFGVVLSGPAGHSINVDWGDGTSNQLEFNQYDFIELVREYNAPGRYRIVVSGKINEITGFKSSYGEGVFDSINVSGLKSLGSVRVGLTHGPKTFDISNNKNLYEVHFGDVQELSTVILPNRHTIRSVSINGPNQLTTAEVDYIVANIYENAIRAKIFEGYFGLLKQYWLNPGDEGYGELVGPPSPSSIDKLRELRDVYRWEVVQLADQ